MKTLTLNLLLLISIALLAGCSDESETITTPAQPLPANLVHDGRLNDDTLYAIIDCLPSGLAETANTVLVFTRDAEAFAAIQADADVESVSLYRVNVFMGTSERVAGDKYQDPPDCWAYLMELMNCCNFCQRSHPHENYPCLQFCVRALGPSDCDLMHISPS